MKMLSVKSFKFSSIGCQILSIGALVTVGILTSSVPLIRSSTPTAGVAYAQPESPFTRYVRTVFEIEKQRRSLMSQVKQLTNGNSPKSVCSSLDQLAGELREPVRGICDNFNAFKTATATKYGLKPDEFNEFQQRARDPEMSKKINEEIKRLNLK